MTNLQPTDDDYAVNKTYLDEKLLKIEGHLSLSKKDYNEFILHYYKQSVAVKTIIQVLYDKKLFDSFPNADKILKRFLPDTRRRTDLREVKMMSFNDFVRKDRIKNKATSNIKTYEVLSSLSLFDIKIYFRDGKFLSDIEIVNLHPMKRKH